MACGSQVFSWLSILGISKRRQRCLWMASKSGSLSQRRACPTPVGEAAESWPNRLAVSQQCGGTGQPWNREVITWISVFIPDHKTDTLRLEFTTTLDQSAGDESFGISNISVWYANNPQPGEECVDVGAALLNMRLISAGRKFPLLHVCACKRHNRKTDPCFPSPEGRCRAATVHVVILIQHARLKMGILQDVCGIASVVSHIVLQL